jgi:hypothetical protein
MPSASTGSSDPLRPEEKEGERDFVQAIRASRASGDAAFALLQTDDRVLARVTDGIYRQPASALRELISNAFDADATQVVIETDAPTFRFMRISDDGQGMDDEALARLIYHIGGSSKRTTVGAAVGTTAKGDPNRSPKGRRLIGKIGIGLFSVSQLTSHFQVITKTKGSDHRLFADVTLQTYSESGEPSDGTFQSGRVEVTAVPTEDKEAHGTEILLLNVRPRARDILRSRDRWQEVLDPETTENPDSGVKRPPLHVGYAELSRDTDMPPTYRVEPNLPWSAEDAPEVRMRKLFDGVASSVESDRERPELAKSVDQYLATVWALSLSAPVEYLEKHPFDLSAEDDILTFQLSNTGRGRATPISLEPGQTVRQALGLQAGATDPAGGFRVFIDQIELKRPISYRYWPNQRQGVGKPMLFVGSYAPDLSTVPAALRGGPLAFEGYLFWNSMVVPKENNGVLVRINGASGANFDDTFMKYQVSEQTRLNQTTSEIFVSAGLDAALNIDRESFNFAHPHYQIVSNWVHRALRQLANTHKGIGDELRAVRNLEQSTVAGDRLDQFVAKTWAKARNDANDRPPDVRLAATPLEAAALRRDGLMALDRTLLPPMPKLSSRKVDDEARRREQVTRAVAAVLDGFGVFEGMAYDRQHQLISALLAVYFPDAQDL